MSIKTVGARPVPPTPAVPHLPAVPSADPAPLGLAGFALTTLLLSAINTGVLKETGAAVPVLALAAFYGGGAQFAAGLFEFRRNNTFGATAFVSYGAFWLSYWWMATHLDARSGDVHQALGLFLLGWCVFTAYMTLAAVRVSVAVLAVFVLLTITFLLLALGEFHHGGTPDPITRVGGWFGVATGLLAWYASAATVVNATHGRTLLPTGPRPART